MPRNVVRILPIIGLVVVGLVLLVIALRSSQGGSGPVVNSPGAVASLSANQGGGPDIEETPDGPTITPLPLINACAVLTKEEAEALLGKLKVDPSPVDSTVREGSCIYTAADDLIVRVTVRRESVFNFRKVDKATIQMLNGIGDEAFAVTEQPVQLWVLVKDKATLVITMSNNDLVQASRVAQKLVAKLRG